MLKVIRLKLPVIWLLVSMWLNTLTKSQIWTFFFFQAEDGIRDIGVTGVQVCSSDLSASVKSNSIGPPRDSRVGGCATGYRDNYMPEMGRLQIARSCLLTALRALQLFVIR